MHGLSPWTEMKARFIGKKPADALFWGKLIGSREGRLSLKRAERVMRKGNS